MACVKTHPVKMYHTKISFYWITDWRVVSSQRVVLCVVHANQMSYCNTSLWKSCCMAQRKKAWFHLYQHNDAQKYIATLQGEKERVDRCKACNIDTPHIKTHGNRFPVSKVKQVVWSAILLMAIGCFLQNISGSKNFPFKTHQLLLWNMKL